LNLKIKIKKYKIRPRHKKKIVPASPIQILVALCQEKLGHRKSSEVPPLNSIGFSADGSIVVCHGSVMMGIVVVVMAKHRLDAPHAQ